MSRCDGVRVSITQRAIKDGLIRAEDPIIPETSMDRDLTKKSPSNFKEPEVSPF